MNSSCKCCGQVASLKCSKCANFHTCSTKSCIESKAWIGHALICGKRERDGELEHLLEMTNPRFKDQIQRAWNELRLDDLDDKQMILWKIALSDTEKTVVNAWKPREDNLLQEIYMLVNVNDFSLIQVTPMRILPEFRQTLKENVEFDVENSYLRFAEFLIENEWNIDMHEGRNE